MAAWRRQAFGGSVAVRKGAPSPAEAKKAVLGYIAQGDSAEQACSKVMRTRQAHEHWRKTDPDYAREVDAILERRRHGNRGMECPDFPEFAERYLHQPLYAHQLRWWDLICDRAPRDMHPSMRFQQGADDQMLLINVPPDHAKSTTLTVNYVTWRICKDPNVRIVIVSSTMVMARKFVGAVKQRLTKPRFADLQRHFGPEGGFKATADSWTQTEIYLGSKDDGEKDPTLQALGFGGQIYGARADLFICDDVVTLKTAHHFDKQIEWLTQEVISRLPEGKADAKLIVAGTRVAPVDMYQQLRDTWLTEDGDPVFTYFAQPAVLEYAPDPKDWVTLWPETVEDGQVMPKWPGPLLWKRKQKTLAHTWTMAYQQQDASDDAVFPAALVQAAVNGMRKPGVPIVDGQPGARKGGMEGLFIVAGLDPATAGFTAGCVLGVDRFARKFYVLDLFNRAGCLPRDIRSLIKDWTVKWGVQEWRIEGNAFQRFLTQDDDIRMYLHGRGVVLKEHRTQFNKIDPDFGVASMTTLFEPLEDGKPSIELPDVSTKFPAAAELFEQLISWRPKMTDREKQDLVMALWFTIIKAREITFQDPGRQRSHMPNQFLSRGRSRQRQVINLEEMAALRAAEMSTS